MSIESFLFNNGFHWYTSDSRGYNIYVGSMSDGRNISIKLFTFSSLVEVYVEGELLGKGDKKYLESWISKFLFIKSSDYESLKLPEEVENFLSSRGFIRATEDTFTLENSLLQVKFTTKYQEAEVMYNGEETGVYSYPEFMEKLESILDYYSNL